MSLHPSWWELAARLVLTVVAAGLIGLNREAHGHAAGLRTTMLVGLAAAVAMIQANILLSGGGKVAGSFAVTDVLRLPLGILTGVGFIGGGAILRRGRLVTGLTTAATMWMVTIIGLAFGGGQLVLGGSATILAVIVLWGLKWVDLRLPRQHHAELVISTDRKFAAPPDLETVVGPLGAHADLRQRVISTDGDHLEFTYEIRWSGPELDGPPLDLLDAVGRAYDVTRFELPSVADR